MGVAKAAMESANRYLARALAPQDIRCNLVAAGPMRTMAAKSIPGFSVFEDIWDTKAPLGWDVNDSLPVASCVALLSDWFPATTAEMIHVDGGYHAMGALRRVTNCSHRVRGLATYLTTSGSERPLRMTVRRFRSRGRAWWARTDVDHTVSNPAWSRSTSITSWPANPFARQMSK